MGGNNVLDRRAVDIVYDLGRQVPVLSSKMEAAEKQLQELPVMGQAIVRLETTMAQLVKAVEDEPARCPFRETAARVPYIEKQCVETRQEVEGHEVALADIEAEVEANAQQIKEHDGRIKGVENTAKKAAGIATVITALGTTIGNVIAALSGH